MRQFFKPNIKKKYIIKNLKGGSLKNNEILHSKNNLYNDYIIENNSMITKQEITELIYSFCVNMYKDYDLLEEIENVYKNLELISKKYTFDEIINFNYKKYKDLSNENDVPFRTYFIHLESYKEHKQRYENYFKKKLIISDKDYTYALPLLFMRNGKEYINYEKINKLKPNLLSEGVYNALLVIDADDIIWKDQLEKGIWRRIEYKNKDGDIYNVEWEKNDGMYELIYGDDD